MGLSKKTRFRVFHRDGFTCQYCGRRPPEVVLEADHIVAKANGGDDGDDNLITSCFDCNRGKSATPLAVTPQTISQRAKVKREALEQLEAYNALVARERDSIDALARNLGTYWFDQFYTSKGKYTFGDDRLASIKRFLKDLPADEVYEAIDIAMTNRPPTRSTGYDQNTWKYFCGVCWNKIREAK